MYFHIIEIIKFQQTLLSFSFPHFSSFPCSTFVDFSKLEQLLGASLIYAFVAVVTYTFDLYKKICAILVSARAYPDTMDARMSLAVFLA